MDQVARGADAAAFRDVGGDPRVDHVPHQLQQLDPHTGVALDQRVQPDGQDAPSEMYGSEGSPSPPHG